MKYFAMNELSARHQRNHGTRKRTLRRNILPVLFMEDNLRLRCLFDQCFDIFRLERGVSTQQNICDDSKQRAHDERHYGQFFCCETLPSRPDIHRFSMPLSIQHLGSDVAQAANKRL